MSSIPLDPTPIRLAKHLSFNADVFDGMQFTHGEGERVIARMITDNQIGVDGKLTRNLADIRPKQLWTYIYYLWMHNHEHIELFASMTSIVDSKKASAKPKAWAYFFVTTITNFLKGRKWLSNKSFPHNNPSKHFLVKEDLIGFLNMLFGDNTIDPESNKPIHVYIKIPFLTALYQRIFDFVSKSERELIKSMDANSEYLINERKRRDPTFATHPTVIKMYSLDEDGNKQYFTGNEMPIDVKVGIDVYTGEQKTIHLPIEPIVETRKVVIG